VQLPQVALHYENGKKSTVSCKTRSWAEAEKVRQAELDKRDPVKKELARIAEREAVKARRREKSIAVTEKYYAKWVKARLRQLEDETIIALQKQGTRVTML